MSILPSSYRWHVLSWVLRVEIGFVNSVYDNVEDQF